MTRAIWSGSISFGLVNVPVKLYSAVRKKNVRFHQLDEKTGARVRNKRVSEKSGREVPYEQIVKAYEVAKGNFVPVTDEDFEAMAPEDTRTIEIEDFVALDEIDPMYFESTYWLAAEKNKGARKAYALLTKAMGKSGRVAIGRFVMRGKQHLATLRAVDGTIALHGMLFPDEIVDPADLGGTEVDASVGSRELEAAGKLIDSLTSKWEPDRYHDTYRERVLELIEKKASGEEIVVPEPTEKRADVVDLMAALEASIESGRRTRASGARKTPATRPAKRPAKKATRAKKASTAKRRSA